MASITEWIQKIKTAIYGEEVRGAIWQSLQAMNDELATVQGSVETSGEEVEDIRVGADGTQYETAGDAVRTQINDLKEDLEYGYNLINVTWEDGSINSSDGAETETSDRKRTSLFQTPHSYLISHTDTDNFSIIEIYKYTNAGVYVDYTYLVCCNNSVLGYLFDSNSKYIIVARDVDISLCFTGLDENDSGYYLSRGSYTNDGVHSPYAQNVCSFKPITVEQNKVLVVKTPKSAVSLLRYENGNFINRLRYQDTKNTVAYFPLSTGYTYQIYIESTNFDECSYEIISIPEKRLYSGALYNGIAIESSGNNRTELINVNRYKYVEVYATVTCFVHKFINGAYTSTANVYCGVWSPAVLYVGDCDFFYITSNGVAEITYNLTNHASLCGKKWCSYGDSITEQQKWQNYLVAKFGLVLSNKGLGGSCVTGNTSASVTPMTDDSRINTIDTDTKYITVMGGTNDFDYCQNIGSVSDLQTSYDTSTFIGSVATIVKKLQTRCPSAKIILMSNVNSRGVRGQNSDTQQVSQYGYTPYDFAKAMKETAEWLSVDYIDTWSCGINQLNRATYVTDTVHPNDAGGKLIALKVMEHFESFLL